MSQNKTPDNKKKVKDEFIMDSNHEFVYFTGKISKHILSKTDDNYLIGVNINDIRAKDIFYKDECKVITDILQTQNQKTYKKTVPRPYLVVFAPKSVNKRLQAIDKYAIGTYVQFKISKGFNTVKDKISISAHDLDISTQHASAKDKKYGTGIFVNSKFVSVNNLSFKDDDLIRLLDVIHEKNEGDVDNILIINHLINKWLAKGIESKKRKEYEEECKKLELLKKNEVKQTSDALHLALQNVKDIYKQTLSTSTT